MPFKLACPIIFNMNTLKKLLLICFLTFILAIGFAKNNDYKIEKLAAGLGVVWSMIFINDAEILFTERAGKVGILNINTKSINYIKNVANVISRGQGGLLDVAINKKYKPANWIYFTYVKEVNNKGATTLARAKLKNNELYAWQDLIVTKSETNTAVHFGSRITFDNKGHLFFTIGDRGVRENAQDLTNHAGKVLRLNLDGSIPYDNPFVNNKNALAEIYSYGHRNPQGIFYDKDDAKLFAIEHGPRGGDEINLISAGRNYGWPIISYGKEYWADISIGEGYEKEGMENPIKQYTPSIAPSSLIVYSGKKFKNWKGNILAGALKLRHINRIEIKNNIVVKEERLLKNLSERIRSLVEDKDGYIYFSTDSGRIFKLAPK